MNGYRRVEPAFCRACGIPWASGSEACTRCGETITAPAPPPTDPYAVGKIKAVLIASATVLVARWIGLAAVVQFAESIEMLWVLTLALPAALALATARWWFPGRRPDAWWHKPPAWAWAGVAGGAAAIVAAHHYADVGMITFGSHSAFGLGLFTWLGLGLALVGVVLEELLFRGLVFDGIRPLGGSNNAAIGSALWSALVNFDPASALAGAVSAWLRARTGSLIPSLVLRIVAVLAGAALLATSA